MSTTLVEPCDSPSGGPMTLTSILVDPADLAVLELFGNGDLATGLHKAVQLVRGKLITEALLSGVEEPVTHS